MFENIVNDQWFWEKRNLTHVERKYIFQSQIRVHIFKWIQKYFIEFDAGGAAATRL
jgi:hypothetical protein